MRVKLWGIRRNRLKLHDIVWHEPLDILAGRVYHKGMTVPIDRRLIFSVPDPEWREALKRLAQRQGISVSQYICNRLAVAVSQEIRAAKEDGEKPAGSNPSDDDT